MASIKDILSESIERSTATQDQLVPRLLAAIRAHLGMDVAFVSEFTDGRRVFRHVDSPHDGQPVQVGGSDLLEESYCQRIVDGRLPELIRDPAQLPEAQALAVTAALPVGAHLSVPLKFSDGRVFGTFCCFSFQPDPSLTERDLDMMRVFADIAANEIECEINAAQARQDKASRVESVLAGDDLRMVYQPIHDLRRNCIVGFEALARFSAEPARTPDLWFKEAAEVGLGVPLELRAIRLALRGLHELPDDCYIAVNASPETLISGKLEPLLAAYPLHRIVLEVTEHAAIDHYAELMDKLKPLRRRGLRLAVDDTGAGYASFRHVLALAPDKIKLDMSITRNIDRDASRRALATALIAFAEATRSRIVAEGVETAAELATLRDLGVDGAQGYLLGKPMSLAECANQDLRAMAARRLSGPRSAPRSSRTQAISARRML